MTLSTPPSFYKGAERWGPMSSGVLKALYEVLAGFKPVAVTGISIGAVTAAVLGGAKGDPIQALDTMWREKFTVSAGLPLPQAIDQSLAAFGDPGMYKLDAKQLLQMVLAPWKSDERLRHRATAQDAGRTGGHGQVERRTTTLLSSAPPTWRTAPDRVHPPPPPAASPFEHVAASGSLPPGFPMTEIDGIKLLGRRTVLQHPAEPGHRRPGRRRRRQQGRGPGVDRHRVVPDERPCSGPP